MVGVTRDRTNLFITFRQSFSHRPTKRRRFSQPTSNGFTTQNSVSEERQGLMSSSNYDDGDAIIEMDLLPPRWLDIQDEVTSLLSTIALKSADLDRLHHKHVLPGFDDEDVKAREERMIEKMTQEITRDFRSCQTAISRIEGMVRDNRQRNGGQGSQAEETMARNIQINLASRVQEASAGFRKKQANYLKKLRALANIPLPSTASPALSSSLFATSSTDPSLLDSETDKSLSLSTLAQQQNSSLSQRQLRSNDAAIDLREREINDIATGIIELADIFKDLQTMVIDQGTMLDRIDYNIENMNINVKEAEKELNVATGYQKQYTKRKIIFLLLLIIVGMIVVLGIKMGRKGGGGGEAGAGGAGAGVGTGAGAGGGGKEEGERLAQTFPQPDGGDPVHIADPNG